MVNLKMDYSKIYDRLLMAHSCLPYWFGGGKSFLPVRVQLELTYRCNLKCAMCYQDKNVDFGEMTTSEWVSLIKQLPRICLVTLIGGEPLVRRDFKEIASIASKLHSCNLVTNGVLLSKDLIKLLIQNKFILIGVSLDGIDSIHDQMRGVQGTYGKVLTNLENLQEEKRKKGSKYPLLDIKTVVTSLNQGNLFDLFRKVEELKADYFTISMPKVSVNQFNPDLHDQLPPGQNFDFTTFNKIEIHELNSELKKIFKIPSKTKIRFYPGFHSVEGISKSLYNPKSIDKIIIKEFFPCRQPWSGVQITANGDVYPCLSLEMGNIREKPFSEIWNSEKFVGFRRDLKEHRLFEDCLGCCYLKQK